MISELGETSMVVRITLGAANPEIAFQLKSQVQGARAYFGLSKPIQERLSYRRGCRSKTSNGIGRNNNPTETGTSNPKMTEKSKSQK
jgi:hypothetical protein